MCTALPLFVPLAVAERPAKRRHSSTSRRPRVASSNHPPPPVPSQLLTANLPSLYAARKHLRRTSQSEPLNQAVILHANRDNPLSSAHWHHIVGQRNQLVVKWLWLVGAVARKSHQIFISAFPEAAPVISFSDLVQEGVFGLITAVERWNGSKGQPFDAYAFYSVKYAILRAIQNQARPIRLPVHVLNKLSKIRTVRHQLQLADGSDVSLSEVARVAGVDRKAAKLYLERSQALLSIDVPVRQQQSSKSDAPPLRDFLVDHSVDVSRQVERKCTREAVAELIQNSQLEDLERSVLCLKYGIGDGIERLRTEVSRILDVRVNTVKRAELSALKKLREVVSDDISNWAEMM
ncbi:RNA polymerase sigma-70 [Gracilaria domingensis]|nr:RNA polymerase sigma-70 [Gracilaria domingensis]